MGLQASIVERNRDETALLVVIVVGFVVVVAGGGGLVMLLTCASLGASTFANRASVVVKYATALFIRCQGDVGEGNL